MIRALALLLTCQLAGETLMRALGLVSGALSILLGLICFRGPAESILLLAIWIGFGWLLRGITQTFVAMSSDALPARVSARTAARRGPAGV